MAKLLAGGRASDWIAGPRLERGRMSEEQRSIQELQRALPWRRRRRILRELETHLEDSRSQLQLQGLPESEAEREAWRRFGEAAEIGGGFADTYRPSRRTRFVLAAGLAGGMLFGVYGLGGSFANANSTHHGGKHARVRHQPSAAGSQLFSNRP